MIKNMVQLLKLSRIFLSILFLSFFQVNAQDTFRVYLGRFDIHPMKNDSIFLKATKGYGIFMKIKGENNFTLSNYSHSDSGLVFSHYNRIDSFQKNIKKGDYTLIAVNNRTPSIIYIELGKVAYVTSNNVIIKQENVKFMIRDSMAHCFLSKTLRFNNIRDKNFFIYNKQGAPLGYLLEGKIAKVNILIKNDISYLPFDKKTLKYIRKKGYKISWPNELKYLPTRARMSP